jgi:hypothetical protein
MLSYKHCKMSDFKQETDNWILNVPLHFLHNKIHQGWNHAHHKEMNTKFWEELLSSFPWYDTDYTENDMFNNSYIVCIFTAAATFLPSFCLAKMRFYWAVA